MISMTTFDFIEALKKIKTEADEQTVKDLFGFRKPDKEKEAEIWLKQTYAGLFIKKK